jgi:hypothetical protein
MMHKRLLLSIAAAVFSFTAAAAADSKAAAKPAAARQADSAAVTKSGIQANTPITPAELESILNFLKDQFKERR